MLLLVESPILNTKWSLIEMLVFIPHGLEIFAEIFSLAEVVPNS